MKSFNKKMIYELGALDKFRISEFQASYSDQNYSRWHEKRDCLADSLLHRYHDILGFPSDAMAEFGGFTTAQVQAFASDLQLSNEKKRELKELRSLPEMKMILGLTALQQKEELESTLGIKINNDSGITMTEEYNPKDLAGCAPRKAFKSEERLDKELDENNTVLSQALGDGQITQAQYDSYGEALGYIYDYYASESRGEQVDFRKMSDAEYKAVEERAENCGLTAEDQLEIENNILKNDIVECAQIASTIEPHL